MVESWRAREAGFPLGDFDGNTTAVISHAIWADNVWLIARSRDQVYEMFSQVSYRLGDDGFEWKTHRWGCWW